MDIKKGKILVNMDEKCIHATNDENFLLVHFKENLPNKDKYDINQIKGKGGDNCSIAVALFKYLKSYHIPTIFNKKFSVNEILVKFFDNIPIKIVIWNVSAAEFHKNYRITNGEPLLNPVVEYYFNDEKLNYPMINMDHAFALGFITPEEFKIIDLYSRKINALLKSYFKRRKLILGKCELQFGRLNNKIVLGSDITPDNCQFWNIEDFEKKHIKWLYLGAVDKSEAYKELKKKLL